MERNLVWNHSRDFKISSIRLHRGTNLRSLWEEENSSWLQYLWGHPNNMCNKMNISNKSPVNNRGNEIRLLWPLSIWIVSTPYSRGAQAANEKWAPKSLLAAGYIPLRLHWPHGEDGMPGTICLCHNEEQHFAVELSAFTSQVTALIFRPVVKTIYRKSSIKLTPPK